VEHGKKDMPLLDRLEYSDPNAEEENNKFRERERKEKGEGEGGR